MMGRGQDIHNYAWNRIGFSTLVNLCYYALSDVASLIKPSQILIEFSLNHVLIF